MRNEDIVFLSEDDRRALILECRKKSHMPHSMIEKDVWVTYVLARIFGDAQLSRILRFKGGTSLSKAHGLIERFITNITVLRQRRHRADSPVITTTFTVCITHQSTQRRRPIWRFCRM